MIIDNNEFESNDTQGYNEAAENVQFLDAQDPTRQVDPNIVSDFKPVTEEDQNAIYEGMKGVMSWAQTNLNKDRNREEDNKDITTAIDFTKESMRENFIKANAKVKGAFMRAAENRTFASYGVEKDYHESEEYYRLKNSDDPQVAADAEKKAQASRDLLQNINFRVDEFDENRESDLTALAMSRDKQQELLANIDNDSFRTTVGFVAPFIGGMADYVEFTKGIAMGAAITATGGALGVGAGWIAAADLGAGAIDNYITSGIENDLKLENFSQEERYTQAAMGAGAQLGLGLLGRGAKHIKPIMKKVIDWAAPVPADKIVTASPTNRSITMNVNSKDIRQAISDDLSNLPEGTTAMIEKRIDKGADENGIIKYSPMEDPQLNINFKNLEQISDNSGKTTGYKGQTRYKGQDVFIETPSKIDISETSEASNIAVLRMFEQANKATVYTLDADGNKVPLLGTDRVNAVRALMAGEHTINATVKNIVEKSQDFQTEFNRRRAEANVYGYKTDVDDITVNLGIAEARSIKKSIEDGIIAPLKRAEEVASQEFFINLGEAAKDYGNHYKMASAFEEGTFASWVINGMDVTNDLNGVQRFLKGYDDVWAMQFADSKSKTLQNNADSIIKQFGDIFKLNEDGNIVVKEDFVNKLGGDLESAAVDLNLNRGLAIEKDSYVAKSGFVNPEDVSEVMGQLFDADRVNSITINKTLDSINDPKITKIFEDAGLLAKNEDGLGAISVEDFLEGIKKIGNMVSDLEDPTQAKNALKAIFDKEKSPFGIKDKSGKITEKLSIADTIFQQMDGMGTSYNAVKKALKPLENLVTNSIKSINKKISAAELTSNLAQGIKDLKVANTVTNDILGDLVPDFRPRDLRGKSFTDMIDGAIQADPKKVKEAFSSKKFKDNVAKLRELNDKYQFLEDDSLFYNLDIDNIVNAEKATDNLRKSATVELENITKETMSKMDEQVDASIENKTNELRQIRENEKATYENTLQEKTQAKVEELEANRESAREMLQSKHDALDTEIKALEGQDVEIDTERINSLKEQLGSLKQELSDIGKPIVMPTDDALKEEAMKNIISKFYLDMNQKDAIDMYGGGVDIIAPTNVFFQDLTENVGKSVKERYKSKTIQGIFDEYKRKYPELKDINLVIKDLDSIDADGQKVNILGTFDWNKKTIFMPTDSMDDLNIGNLRHEIQHAIDQKRDLSFRSKRKPYKATDNYESTMLDTLTEYSKGHHATGSENAFEISYMVNQEFNRLKSEASAKMDTPIDIEQARAKYNKDVASAKSHNEKLRKEYEAKLAKQPKIDTEVEARAKYDAEVKKAEAINAERQAEYDRKVEESAKPKRRILDDRTQMAMDKEVDSLQAMVNENPAIFDQLSPEIQAELVAPKYADKAQAKGISKLEKDLKSEKLAITNGYNNILKIGGKDIPIKIEKGAYKSDKALMDIVKKQLPKDIQKQITPVQLEQLTIKLTKPSSFGLANLKSKTKMSPDVDAYLKATYGEDVVSSVKKGVISKPSTKATSSEMAATASHVKKMQAIIDKNGSRLPSGKEVPKPEFLEIPEFKASDYTIETKADIPTPNYIDIPEFDIKNYSEFKQVPEVDTTVIKAQIKDLEKEIKELSKPKSTGDKKAIGVLKRKLSLMKKEITGFDANYDKQISDATKNLASSRNKDVFQAVNAKKAEIKAQKDILNGEIKNFKSIKNDINKKTKSIISDIKKAKSISDYNNLDLNARIDEIKSLGVSIGVNDLDINLENISRVFSEAEGYSKLKGLSGDEAIQKVATSLKSVMEQSKGINEKAINNKRNDIKAVKDRYAELQQAIKRNSKNDFTSVYDQPEVIRAMDKLSKAAKKAEMGDAIDDLIPKEVVDMHKEILGRAKQMMDEGRVARPKERVKRARKNQLNRKTLKMARISQMINQSRFLNDRTFFTMGDLKKRMKVEDIPLTKFLEDSTKEGAELDMSKFKYTDYVREDKLGEFENLYNASKQYFAEVSGDDGLPRDLDINEFAIAYHDFIQDMDNTRADIGKWSDKKRGSLANLIPYFKDEDAMVSFLTMDNAAIGRTGYIKGNLDVVNSMLGVAKSSSAYNAIGMAKETFAGMLKNQNNPMLRDAIREVEGKIGKSSEGKARSKYYDTFTEYVDVAFSDPAESQIPKILSNLFDAMYLNFLFGSGAKEYAQTAVWTATNKAKLLGKDLDSTVIAKEFFSQLPKAALHGAKSIPLFFKEVMRGSRDIVGYATGNLNLNKELSKFQDLKPKTKYVGKIMEREIKRMNAQRHLQSAQGAVKAARLKGEDQMGKTFGQYAKNAGDFFKETAYVLQKENDINKNMRAHETSYDVMGALLNTEKIEDITSNNLKSILHNLGVTDATLTSLREFMGRNLDEDGAIALDFYDLESMMKGMDMGDQKLAQTASNIYNAAFYQASVLNKEMEFDKAPRTVFGAITGFLKNTTTGIAKQDVFDAIYKMDDSGNYINRIGSAFREGGSMEGLKSVANTALYAGTFFGITGLAVKLGSNTQNFYKKPQKLQRDFAEYVGNITSDDPENNTKLDMVGNIVLDMVAEGIKGAPFAGGYMSGGNAIADQGKSFLDMSYKYWENPDAESALTNLLDDLGWETEDDGFASSILKNAVTKTAYQMFMPAQYMFGTIGNWKNLATEDGMATTLRNDKDKARLYSIFKDSEAKSYAAQKAYAELISFNLKQEVQRMGAVTAVTADELLNAGTITPEEHVDMKLAGLQSMGVKEDMYEKLSPYAQTYGNGTMKLLGIDTDLGQAEFQFQYFQSVNSGMTPRDAVAEYLPGPTNGPELVMEGKKALTKSQAKTYETLSKDFNMKEEEMIQAIAENATPADVFDKALEVAKPKSKEAKEMVKDRTNFDNTYEENSESLAVIDKLGNGLITDTYLQQKGINMPVSEVSDKMKKKLLMEDYYLPMKDVVKNENHRDSLFPISVALGADYVNNIYDNKGGDLNKTLDYIYEARMSQRDYTGELKQMIERAKSGKPTPEPKGPTAKDYVDSVTDEDIQEAYVGEDLRNINEEHVDFATGEVLEPVVEEQPQETSEIIPEDVQGEVTSKTNDNRDSVGETEKAPKENMVSNGSKKDKILNRIVEHFRKVEGTGDKTGAAPTGDLGVTLALKAKLDREAGRKLTWEEASKMYSGKIYDKINKINPNFPEDKLQTMISTFYNLGEGAVEFTHWKKYLNNPTDANFENAMLRGATIKGKTSKGLIRRRALDYNAANPKDPIVKIEAKHDGTAIYVFASGKKVENQKGLGHHESSTPGVMKI